MSGSLDDIQPDQARYDYAAISRARARGVSWTQIGDYYGVTKNAVANAYWHYETRDFAGDVSRHDRITR